MDSLYHIHPTRASELWQRNHLLRFAIIGLQQTHYLGKCILPSTGLNSPTTQAWQMAAPELLLHPGEHRQCVCSDALRPGRVNIFTGHLRHTGSPPLAIALSSRKNPSRQATHVRDSCACAWNRDTRHIAPSNRIVGTSARDIPSDKRCLNTPTVIQHGYDLDCIKETNICA